MKNPFEFIKNTCKEMKEQGLSYYDVLVYLNDIIYDLDDSPYLERLYKLKEHYHHLYEGSR